MELFSMTPTKDGILDAIRNLEPIKQEVLKRRFGFHGDGATSYEDIARYLSTILEPTRRQSFISCQKSKKAGLLSEKDVQKIEAEALRDLYTKKATLKRCK
jgi:hypothetical protein